MNLTQGCGNVEIRREGTRANSLNPRYPYFAEGRGRVEAND